MALDLYRPFSRLSSQERWDPLRSLMDVQGEMNRLFDTFFTRTSAPPTLERAWAPFVDIYETKDEIVVTADLPGVKEQEIEASMVAIKGERRHQQEHKEENFHRIERAYGTFERQITVPIPVQTDKVRALFKEGVLEVHLPRAEEVKPKQVKIEVG